MSTAAWSPLGASSDPPAVAAAATIPVAVRAVQWWSPRHGGGYAPATSRMLAMVARRHAPSRLVTFSRARPSQACSLIVLSSSSDERGVARIDQLVLHTGSFSVSRSSPSISTVSRFFRLNIAENVTRALSRPCWFGTAVPSALSTAVRAAARSASSAVRSTRIGGTFTFVVVRPDSFRVVAFCIVSCSQGGGVRFSSCTRTPGRTRRGRPGSTASPPRGSPAC